MSPITVFEESVTEVVLEVLKTAVLAPPLGTMAGVQLPAVFQSPEPGFSTQVCADVGTTSASKQAARARGEVKR
ncbi:MAG: hypothetical protein AAGA67_07695 [Cyanobacteria bacterium P01_F01_bin.153]